MTGQELKQITHYANARKLQLTHRRTGYFVHVVHIGSHDYLDASKALTRLKTMHERMTKLL